MSTPGLLQERSARWMRVRVLGLLRLDSQLRHAMEEVNERRKRKAPTGGT